MWQASVHGFPMTMPGISQLDAPRYLLTALCEAQQQYIFFIDVDGFQHGNKEFTIKCLALVCLSPNICRSMVFNTKYPLNCPDKNIFTYMWQESLHGFPITMPGISQLDAPGNLLTALCEAQQQYIEKQKLPAHHCICGQKADKSATLCACCCPSI